MPSFPRAGAWFRFGLLAALTTAATSAASTPPSPLVASATVIVVSGLPGDVEHERAYEAHTRRLLEALAAADPPPRSVVVLADDPARVARPQGLPVSAGPATRAGILGLAGAVSRADGPVTLFVFGHGGAQGPTPVFHVRGPRATPADFATVLEGLRARPLRAVLMFRGSGQFARALRGAGREILSSDHEVAFRDDPVGMDLLLPILRDGGTVALADAAARLGPAVADWYAGQGLARTEEPTLWQGQADPVRVAPPPATLASGGEGAGDPPARPAPHPEVETSAGGSPPGAWQGIRAVDPAAHPGHPAIVLRREETYTLGQNTAVTHEVDAYVQVLTAEGVSYGDVDVAYSPPEERLTFLDCEVRAPDGQMARLDSTEVRDAGAAPLPPGYRGPSRKMFSLPGVRPGAILRVHYRSEWARFPLPHVLLEVPLGGAVPVLTSRVEVRVPTDAALHWAFRHAPRREPVVARTSYGTSHAWWIEGTPAVAGEDLSPPDLTPRLMLSTFPDWPAFSAWYRRLIQHADEITPEIAAEAARLTADAADELAKVQAVYHRVARMRYVAIPIGVNSHRPHAAAHVLRNGYGDCKDKANLFNALLRAVGIAADLVLVPRFSQAEAALPGHGFNHAISRVRLGGRTLWVDTTDENCRFGLLPPGDPGRNVLVVDGESARLEPLPAPDPKAHRLSITGTLDLREDGRAPGALSLQATGHADYALRAAVRTAAGLATRPVLAQEYRPLDGMFAMTRQEHGDATAIDEEFQWRAEGTWAGVTAALPGGRRLVRAPFWVPREWDAALHPRRAPLFLNQGYPLALAQQLTVQLPFAARVALPPSRAREQGPLRYRREWTAEGSSLRASLQVELATAELDGAATAEFQDALRELLRALGEGPTYEAP